MTQIQQTSALTYLQSRPLTPAATFALKLVVIMVKWSERARTRTELCRLEPHVLEDIGITQAQAKQEAEKPFWLP